jgi:hypothetical protein
LLNLRHLLVHPIELLEICAKSGKKKADLAEDGEDVAGRDVPGGGEAETSPKTRTARAGRDVAGGGEVEKLRV